MTKMFKGVLFTLKKRVQSINVNDSEYYKFHIFGYYDGLDINMIDKWYEFRPRGLQDRHLQVDLTTPFIDQYTIRVLMPENRDVLEKEQGFDYSFWEQVGTNEKNIESIRKNCPFFTMSILNLSRRYVHEYEDFDRLQADILDLIKQEISNAGYCVNELHCAVFPSVGYSDYIIVFMVDNLKKASDVIGNLRGVMSRKQNKVFSNCYSVCGLDRNCFIDSTWLDNIQEQQNSRITIRINLKEGISIDEFKEQLRGVLTKDTELLNELEDSYFTTFDNSDCFILPSKPLNCYLKLYVTKQVLNPDSNFFKKYITSIRTSVRISDIPKSNSAETRAYDEENHAEQLSIGNPEDADNRNKNETANEWKQEFVQFIEKYETFLTTNNMHIRSSKALQHIMKNYMNLVQTGHSFDIEHILGKAFRVLISNAEYYINLHNSLLKAEDEESYEEALEIRNELQDAVMLFKDYIGTFITDLARSDRFFIEGNTLTHSSIASATKLIFVYTTLLEKLTKAYNVEDKYTFVVISGGCDLTQIHDLFSFATPDEKINKLVIIRIPEMSLYDVQGTLFRILHECMHFVGDRKRKERYTYFLHAAADIISWNMVYLEYMNKRFMFDTIRDLSGETANGPFMDKLNNSLKKIYMKCAEKIQECILRVDAFARYKENVEEKYYYTDVLSEEILSVESMTAIFRCSDIEKNELIKNIYDALAETHKEVVLKICDVLQEEYDDARETDQIRAMKIRFALESAYQMKRKCNLQRECNKRDQKLMNNIISYLEVLFGNNIPVAGADWIGQIEELDQKDSEQLDEIEKKITLFTWGYFDMREDVLSAMIESFSDCTAIKTLDMPEEDFLLSFIYEVWDIEKAFPMTIADTLRLGADLKVSYNTQGELGDETIQRIRNKEEVRRRQGYAYRNVDDMITRINVMLKDYQHSALAGVVEVLEKYLSDCMVNALDGYSDEMKQLYNWSKLDPSESVYNAVNKIFSLWIIIGKEEAINDEVS